MSVVQRLLTKIPQYTRGSRHLRSFIEHGTPRKWANLAMAEAERLLRRVTVRSHPYLLIVDPCNYCNLRCPLCPTGMKTLGRIQSMMSLDSFKDWFDPLAPFLFEASLHNWGESLMNPELFDMVAHAREANVGTNLSSNLVIAKSHHLDAMIDSGLEYLVVSLDGVNQSTYEPYRVRGDFERVVDNVSELLRRRNARRAKTPVIEWQFIVMKHNQHVIGEAERLARKLGVDLIRFLPVGLPFEDKHRWSEWAKAWYPTVAGEGSREPTGTEQQFGQGVRPGPCFYLYRSMTVNADGGVSPCCVVYRQDRDFAQIKEGYTDVMSVWNNEHFRAARSLFSPEQSESRRRTVCDECHLFAHPMPKRCPPLPPKVTVRVAVSDQQPGEGNR